MCYKDVVMRCDYVSRTTVPVWVLYQFGYSISLQTWQSLESLLVSFSHIILQSRSTISHCLHA